MKGHHLASDTYYLSDRLGEARTQYFLWSCLTDAVRSDAVALARPIARYVAGRNKISLPFEPADAKRSTKYFLWSCLTDAVRSAARLG
jgi:hypothetical protein